MRKFDFMICLTSGFLASATAAPAAPIAGAQDGWAAITACAQVRDDEARRDCTDGVLRRAGLLTDAPGSAGPISHGAEPASAPRSQAHLGIITLPSLPPPSEPQETTVVKSWIDGDGKLVLVTNDGKTWLSEDGGLSRPRNGQPVTIRKNAFGSYDCHLSQWEDYLCRSQR